MIGGASFTTLLCPGTDATQYAAHTWTRSSTAHVQCWSANCISAADVEVLFSQLKQECYCIFWTASKILKPCLPSLFCNGLWIGFGCTGRRGDIWPSADVFSGASCHLGLVGDPTQYRRTVIGR
mmetsp:Transcript_158430/g.504121  ORF Transcript_158430/g.504121 Transcript_158430/m.504121 type:complete len:124 (-) Transcript_158430:30-401(-)